MKSMVRVIAALFCVAAALAEQPQHIAFGEVPEGITAEDWGIVQEAYLKASYAEDPDEFGGSVCISGDTIVVGAHRESSNATGVNANQADNSASASGAAYVFVRSGTTWTQQAYLKASNTDIHDQFGGSIAISENTIVVGVPNEDSSATGINGNQADNSAEMAGAAYVFVRNGTTWTQQAYLKASNTDSYDRFGYSVAISGNTITVGAPGEASGATGVNGDQSNTAGNAGAAYVFVRTGTTWSQQAYLKASNTDAVDHFGEAVAISGDSIVVGALDEDSNATGVNGNQADNSAGNAGAAYVFVRSGTMWSQQAYLKASNTDYEGDGFGDAVAISENTIVVGAQWEGSNATGVNGNQSDNSIYEAGAAYVFVRNGTTWSQQAYLKASNTDGFDAFGSTVSISGDTIVIGAGGEDSDSTGINGDQGNVSYFDAGAAYVFSRNGASWSQQAYLKASNTDAGDSFGLSAVAISGGTIVATATSEDSSASGVNGNQADNNAINAGAAYVFTGFGSPGSAIITDCSPVPAGIRIEWVPFSGNNSIVKCSTDLVNEPFATLSTALPYPVNSYTDTVHGAKSQCFYQVDLEP